MSRPMTPGERPAPDMAWRLVISTAFTPKRSASGARVMARPVVVQLGMGTMKPL
jgi:hypothetical protein